MIIKNHLNKNDYLLVDNGLWVRDFTKKSVRPMDINDLIPKEEFDLLLDNEVKNHAKLLQRIDTESLSCTKIIIVGDGYDFENKQKLLEKLPDITIMGINDVLVNWHINRLINYYIINNPFEDCLNYLPTKQNYAKCIASTRTCSSFIDKLKGIIYEYSPVTNKVFGGLKSDAEYFIDDYRNAACAAIGLAFRFNVKRLLLFGCDDVFKDQRPGSEILSNKMYIYPQQKISHKLIDGNFYWLKQTGTVIGCHSSYPEYKQANYITESDISRFFV